MSHMTMIDNRLGFGASIANADEYNTLLVELNDNLLYGEAEEISDCPDDGSYCKAFDKFAVIFNGGTSGDAQTLHIIMASGMPFEKLMGSPAWGLVSKMNRNKFMNFQTKTALGRLQGIFFNEPNQSDYIPMIEGFDNEFVNLKDGAFATLSDPNPKWANLKDCGDFPCTAPSNILVSFQNTVWTGLKPRWATKDFQVI